MVKIAMPAKFAMAMCLYVASASAESLKFINKCTFPIELYHSQKGSAVAKQADIAVGATYSTEVSGPAHMFRHTANPAATLLEMGCDGWLWYDMSIITPAPGWCGSYEECKAGGTKTGFNVPMSVTPMKNIGKDTCAPIFCAADDKIACADAYLFPMDNTKTHNCPIGSGLEVVFCYANNGDNAYQNDKDDPTQQTPDPENTVEQTSPVTGSEDEERGLKGRKHGARLDVKAAYSYKGKFAGNVPVTYERVTHVSPCTKKPVQVHSPIGPMIEPVSMVFRGPMEIENIAVYAAEGANSSWNRVSSYSRKEGKTENMVFMNNMNVDYTGKRGPQGFASADGKSSAKEPTVFGGVLDDATDPSRVGGGPGVSTGVEINIMTDKKCNGGCLGFAGENDYDGWGGGKKAFVTKVKMPNRGKQPNMPAIWILNAQILHSSQYGCNCRCMGPVGGCAELDIAEVIETNIQHDKVSTHYYFGDGAIVSPNGDNFAPRPFDKFVVYVTLFDDSKDGLIKIVELADFDFSVKDLGPLYHQLVNC